LLRFCIHFWIILHLFIALTGSTEQTGAEEVVGGAKFASWTFAVEREKQGTSPRLVPKKILRWILKVYFHMIVLVLVVVVLVVVVVKFCIGFLKFIIAVSWLWLGVVLNALLYARPG